jgi:hypothetical protein
MHAELHRTLANHSQGMVALAFNTIEGAGLAPE